MKGLLDELVELTGCLYMSDLHAYTGRKICKALESVEQNRYDSSEWREAYSYITGKKLKDGTEAEVRELFRKNMD